MLYVPINEIARWPRNPKLHDLDRIESSMKRFGYVLPMTRDDATGKLVAGHGRLEVLLRMQARGESPPARIPLDSQGRWMAPVLTGVEFEDESEAEAYLLVDNRLVELGGWDEGALAALLADQVAHSDSSVGDLGWTDEQVKDLMETQERLVNPPPPTAPDGFPEFNGSEKATIPCPRCGFHLVVEGGQSAGGS